MSSAIAWTGSSVIIVGNAGSELYAWSQQAGTTPWNKQSVANGNFGDAQIAWTGSSSIVTAAAASDNASLPDGTIYYWWQEAGTSIWNMQTVATPPFGALYAWPSIAWTGSSVVIAAAIPAASGPDPSAGLFYWWQGVGQSSWHQQTVAMGKFTFPAIAWTGSSVIIVAPDDEGNLNYWWQGAGTSTWHQQTVATATAGNIYAWPSIAWTGNSVVITAVEVAGTETVSTPQGGNLYYWWQGAGTNTWHQQTVAAGDYIWPSIALTTCSLVITAVDASGSASTGNVYYFWQPIGASGWNSETVATGSYSSPSIAAAGCSTVITAPGGSAGDIYFWWQGAPPWNIEQVA